MADSDLRAQLVREMLEIHRKLQNYSNWGVGLENEEFRRMFREKLNLIDKINELDLEEYERSTCQADLPEGL